MFDPVTPRTIRFQIAELSGSEGPSHDSRLVAFDAIDHCVFAGELILCVPVVFENRRGHFPGGGCRVTFQAGSLELAAVGILVTIGTFGF